MKMRWRDMIKDRSKENTIWDYIIPIGLTLISILFFVVGMSVLSALGHGTPPEPNVVLFFIFLPISIVISVVYYLLTKYLSRFHRVLLFPIIGGIAIILLIFFGITANLKDVIFGLASSYPISGPIKLPFIFFSKFSKFFFVLAKLFGGIAVLGTGYTLGSLILYLVYRIRGS